LSFSLYIYIFYVFLFFSLSSSLSIIIILIWKTTQTYTLLEITPSTLSYCKYIQVLAIDTSWLHIIYTLFIVKSAVNMKEFNFQMEYQGTIPRSWAITIKLGKFQNNIYSKTWKRHNNSL
jgi:hypothetical protein